MANMNARILLVSRAFPPFAPSLGGAVRILKLAEYFQAQGADVHVLAGRGRYYSDFGYGALLKALSVHYVDDPLLARTGPPVENGGQSAVRIRAHLRPLVSECLIPDTGVLAVPRLVRTANGLIARHELQHIITSGPPHSDHLVGLAAKRRFGGALNWIADYRDSWNGTALFRKKTWLLQRINLALERRVLARADHLTYISIPMRDKMIAIAGKSAATLADKTSLVMNGFDATVSPNTASWVPCRGPLTIGYFGALDDRPDGYRNPAAIFDTVLKFGLDVRFEFFGQIRLSPRWQELLGDRLRINGSLSHSETMIRMRDSDVLMLLHTKDDGADEVITGKFFEYLLSGRPILSVGPRVMAVNALLTELGCGYIVRHDDTGQLAEMLGKLIERKANDALPTQVISNIGKFSRSEQYSTFLRLLDASMLARTGG